MYFRRGEGGEEDRKVGGEGIIKRRCWRVWRSLVGSRESGERKGRKGRLEGMEKKRWIWSKEG